MDCSLSTVLLIIIVIAALLYLLKKYTAGGVFDGWGTMAGKTVVITGANTGIGKETIKSLAMRGARIVMGCRDMEKAKKACQEITALTNNKNIECRKLDLASFESIRAFAKSILDTESKIDVLINNAGVMFCSKRLTKDGLEFQMGVNYFGHFLLTNLLLDRLKKSAPSRIVILSSIGHQWGHMDFDDLHSEKNYSRFQAYFRSKLANLLHMIELEKRLKGTGVTVNCLHPGGVDTDLFQHVTWGNSLIVHALMKPYKYFLFKSPWEGAQTSLRLAVDAKLETVTGKYFSDCVEKSPAPQALNEADAKRLWDISEVTVGEKKAN